MADKLLPGALKPGVKLGKYEVREQLATGGMAIVYKAHDPALDRYVAIKQIAPHLAQDARFLERFRSEAQTLARLSTTQPNIVTVHELIQQNGELFLVMEYVEGTTLRAMMDRGPIPLQTGLGVLLSTTLGLRAMHGQGIVHRDLSPANLMLAKDGALKITDFGLIGHSGGRTSLPMGTTKYMAPEMFTGAPVDPRADLYSLGMIAYEMFAGPEKFAEAFHDVLRDERAQQVRWMHWHANPALRAASLKDLQPGIPPLVAKIVERMMEKDPSRRFASADQIVRWLRRIFVMHVQGKSVSVKDSESLEKELESEGTVAVSSPVRPGAAAAPVAARADGAATATAEPPTGEKTEPLPKPKLTWKRAALWAGVIGGPLVALAVGVGYWRYHEEQVLLGEAYAGVGVADEFFRSRQYEDARKGYVKVAQEPRFRTLEGILSRAMQGMLMAQAEASLQKKDWEAADRAANDAERKGAPTTWVSDYRGRFVKGREVEQRLNEAKVAQKNGDFERTLSILSDLAAQNPDIEMEGGIKLPEYIAQLRDQLAMGEYRRLVDEGKKEAEKGTMEGLAAAWDFFNRARRLRDTPEVLEEISKVELRTRATKFYAQAEKAVQDGKWKDAADLYAEVLKIQPSEAVRSKMNHARAEDLAGQAKTLKESGLMKEATALYVQVLQHNPQHADALAFLKAQGQKEQLENFIKAGDEAMAKKEWTGAINSYEQALPLLDKADKVRKEQIEGQINEARYQAAMAAAWEAFGQKKFAIARQYALTAQKYKDTQEVKDFLAMVDKAEDYENKLTLGKELLKQGNYVQAIAQLNEAGKVDPSTEVADLTNEAQYRRYLAQGKSLMKDMQYRAAASVFRITRKYKDTPEAQALEQEAERLAAEVEKKTGPR